MNDMKEAFIRFAIKQQVLKFGEFTLKSGRISPYFFNAGLFHDGASLSQLGEFYAKILLDAELDFDGLFGPAYKGLPLATTTAVALARHGLNTQVSFNRKEAKQHGEGGQIIGAPLAGKLVMIDDVITAGTAFRESKSLIEAQGASLAGVIIALDRQEKGLNTLSAIQEIEQTHGIPVLSVIQLKDLITYLTSQQNASVLDKIRAYRAQYGC